MNPQALARIQSLDNHILTTEQYLIAVDEYSVATEGLGTIILKIFDSFAGIVSNVSVSLTNLINQKDVKRTELRYFIDNNRSRVKRLSQLQYTLVYNTKIPIIRGMQDTYTGLVFSLKDLFNEMNMEDRCKLMLDAMTNLTLELQKDKPNLKKSLSVANNVFSPSTGTKIKKVLNKSFNIDDRTLEKPFGDVFKSMTEFNSTVDETLAISKKYDAMSNVYDSMQELQKKLDVIIEVIKERKLVFLQTDIRDLSSIVHMYANMFELYAIIINRFHNVDHNITYVLNALLKKHV